MILAIELIIILIGVGIFLVQKSLNQKTTPRVLRIIYWTIMLFISLSFNSIQVYLYPHCYNIDTYKDLYGFINLAIVILLFILIQCVSPSGFLKNKFSKKRPMKAKLINKEKMAVEENMTIKVKIAETSAEVNLAEALSQDYIVKDESVELRERHYEIFLETICWFTFILVLFLQVLNDLWGNNNIFQLFSRNLITTSSLILVLSTAIILRQVVFYLMMIRKLEDKKTISKSRSALTLKLEKEHTNL